MDKVIEKKSSTSGSEACTERVVGIVVEEDKREGERRDLRER